MNFYSIYPCLSLIPSFEDIIEEKTPHALRLKDPLTRFFSSDICKKKYVARSTRTIFCAEFDLLQISTWKQSISLHLCILRK